MPKVLVTGGAGFIGATLVPDLLAEGYTVVVVDNFSRGRRELLPVHERLDVHVSDIRDTAAMTSFLLDCDAIVHLAAYGSVVESVEAPAENFSINVEGTFSVLRAAQAAKVRRVILASTGGALIGNAVPPVDERSVPRPISPYGASKLAGEGYGCAFAHSYCMDITSLRFANVIGPHSLHKKGAVANFFKAIIDGRPITIFGDGSSTRDYIYVKDLSQGIRRGLAAKISGFNVFHLASGREVSARELAELCIKVSGKAEHPLKFEPKRDGEVDRNSASSLVASLELGFEPEHSIEQGLALTWAWFSSNYSEAA
jgi:UDP-glucose 4-epimerase